VYVGWRRKNRQYSLCREPLVHIININHTGMKRITTRKPEWYNNSIISDKKEERKKKMQELDKLHFTQKVS